MCLHIYASAISRFRDEPRSDNPWHASHAHPSDVEARRGSSRPRIHAPVAGFEGSFDILVFSKRKKKKIIQFNFIQFFLLFARRINVDESSTLRRPYRRDRGPSRLDEKPRQSTTRREVRIEFFRDGRSRRRLTPETCRRAEYGAPTQKALVLHRGCSAPFGYQAPATPAAQLGPRRRKRATARQGAESSTRWRGQTTVKRARGEFFFLHQTFIKISNTTIFFTCILLR